MKAIVAVSKNWGIGYENSLLFSIPTDMKFFRDTTKGNTVVMGRKTLDSFPGGKPLKNRRNIVFSKSVDAIYGAEVVSSEDELKSLIKDDENVFVIGGGSIYALLLPLCDAVLVTMVDAEKEADTFFPNLDNSNEWKIESESEPISENGLSFVFRTYKRK